MSHGKYIPESERLSKVESEKVYRPEVLDYDKVYPEFDSLDELYKFLLQENKDFIGRIIVFDKDEWMGYCRLRELDDNISRVIIEEPLIIDSLVFEYHSKDER